MNPKVDAYLRNVAKWQEELEKLRKIILDCGLTEAYKWKHPCYTYQKKNIVLIHGFKEYCALLFCKGALLKDPDKILVRQTENVQFGRQIRFTRMAEIEKLETTLKTYVFEAVEAEKAGLEVKMKKTSEFNMPEELLLKFGENPGLKTAFENLTPGRQRGYLLYFSGAGQSKTRASRIERNCKRILDGKGLNDCVCGLSKKMPNCDGSHKYLKETD